MSDELEGRIYRLEAIVLTLAGWLVDVQTGFGEHDYKGIKQLIHDSREKYGNDSAARAMDEE